MKWNHIKQLLEYFDEYSDEQFKDLVDYLDGLSPEEIDGLADQLSSTISRDFLDAYIEFVIEFSKFEKTIQDEGGLVKGNYATENNWYTDLKKDEYIIYIFNTEELKYIQEFIQNDTIGRQLFSEKFKVLFSNLILKMEHFKKIFSHVKNRYIVVTDKEIQKRKNELIDYNNMMQAFLTVDYTEIINHLKQNTKDNYIIYLLTDFKSKVEDFIEEFNKILRPTVTFSNNIYDSHIISAYMSLSKVFVPFKSQLMRSKVYKIFPILLTDLFNDVSNDFDNRFDDMSNLSVSHRKIKLLRQIEQICIEIAEDLDLM